MSVAVFIFGLLAVWSPFPLSLWKTHIRAVTYASEAIAYLPMVMLLAFLLTKLFTSSRALNALLSMTLTLLACSAGSLFEPGSFLIALAEPPALTISLLLAVPIAVGAIERLQSNYRLERP